MELSNEQIKDLLERKPHQRQLEKGIRHQKRLRFHTETALSRWDFDSAYFEFRQWIAVEAPEILPADKAARVLQFIRPPISTVELTESIFSRLRKIFHSQNAFFDYRFSNPELRADWDEYRDKSFWATHGFQAMQSAIDSVWCVDFPETQSGSRPEPFDRLIRIDDVVDIQNDENNNCEYFIYKSGDNIIVYDSSTIRVFEFTGQLGSELAHISHGLGYTPARMFWSEILEDGNYINKESPLTKSLSDLDWYLLHTAAKKYMDLANAYPRELMYESDDDSDDPDRTDNKERLPAGKRTAGNKLMGPGSIIEVPIPKDNTEPDLMRNPFMLISPDVATLEWHVSEEKRLKNDIYRSVVGADHEVKNEQAKNEMQVDAAFESQLAVLLRIKKNFEIIQTFSDATKCRLRYQKSFTGCSIDYGTGFFLKTVSDLHEDYKLAKESGNNIVLSEITDTILDSTFREDKASRQRAEIIRELDPLPEKTDREAIEIFKNGGVNKINFIIKTNLLNFVRRFERENIPLVEFGANIEYNTKIDTIINKFKEYASEQGSELPNQ